MLDVRPVDAQLIDHRLEQLPRHSRIRSSGPASSSKKAVGTLRVQRVNGQAEQGAPQVTDSQILRPALARVTGTGLSA